MFVAPCGEVQSVVRPRKSIWPELGDEAQVSQIAGSHGCAIAGVDGATKLIATVVVRDTEPPKANAPQREGIPGKMSLVQGRRWRKTRFTATYISTAFASISLM
jgi:hypothetical protein